MEAGYLQDVYTSGPLQSSYQLKKFMMHSVPQSPSTSKATHSLFTNPSTSQYQDYIVNAVYSGAVKIDGNRRNFIFAAGRHTGFSYEYGVLAGPTDGVLVVLTSDAARVHAYPVPTRMTATCVACGKAVPTDYDLIPPSGITL